MSDTWRPPSPSAFDNTPWPDALLARAVDRRDGCARIHGYDVADDLVPNYSHSDLVYLTIAGSLPNNEQSWLFHVAACSLSTVSINEAPAHIGHLGRMCGGSIASVFAAAAISAADNARRIVSEHATLQAWLDGRDVTGTPPEYRAVDDNEARYVGRLVSAARRVAPVPARVETLGCRALQVALLHLAGLQRPEEVEAAMAWAIASGAIAEALMTKANEFNRYPALLPAFRYVEDIAKGARHE